MSPRSAPESDPAGGVPLPGQSTQPAPPAGLAFRPLTEDMLTPALLAGFDRTQPVNLCWRRTGSGLWEIRPDPFTDDWSEADRTELLKQLAALLQGGGFAEGAFCRGALKGFVSVDAAPYGRAGDYRDLTNLHVSRELRGQGVGRTLFFRACAWARGRGAARLYISAHSAAETQAFYRGLGCVDTLEPSAGHMAAEPFDCQLEYRL